MLHLSHSCGIISKTPSKFAHYICRLSLFNLILFEIFNFANLYNKVNK